MKKEANVVFYKERVFKYLSSEREMLINIIGEVKEINGKLVLLNVPENKKDRIHFNDLSNKQNERLVISLHEVGTNKSYYAVEGFDLQNSSKDYNFDILLDLVEIPSFK